MEPVYFNPSFTNWLVDHSELNKYIEINSVNQASENEKNAQNSGIVEMRRQKQISRLTQFKESALEALFENQRPPEYDKISRETSSYGVSAWNSHLLFFVKMKQFKIKKKFISDSIKKTESLINLLRDPNISVENFDIIIYEDMFFKEMLMDSPKVISLEAFTKQIFNIQKLKTSIFFQNENQSQANFNPQRTSYHNGSYEKSFDRAKNRLGSLKTGSPKTMRRKVMYSKNNKYKSEENLNKIYQSKILFSSDNNGDTYIDEILSILVNTSLQVDKTSYYFSENKLQEKFDEIIFQKDFFLHNDISNFLDTFTERPRQNFIQDVNNIYRKLAYSLRDIDAIESSCCFILLIRSLFSNAYKISSTYFYPKFDENEPLISKIANKVPCNFLSIEDEALPPHQPSDSIVKVMIENECFVRGANHLEFASMLTNPIDAIYEIHEMMTYNHQGVILFAKSSGSQAFSFETSFGLYIATVLLSDLPNFEHLARFVIDFSPPDDLCPEFDYVLKTTQAALNFCPTLLKSFS